MKNIRTKDGCTVDAEAFRGFIDVNGDWIELQDCGDGKTFVSKDILFFFGFNKDWDEANANVFEGSEIQIALKKWFDEKAPKDIKDEFDIDLLTMTEIFGETREDGDEKFWPDEPYERLPLFRDWRNRTKGEPIGDRPRWWWTKSPCSGYANYACCVNSYGSANYNSVGDNSGVVPCFRRKAQ